jgi:hypothetical protein
MRAKIVQMPLWVGGDAGVVSQPGAQAARPVGAAQVNINTGRKLECAQSTNRQVDGLRQ